MLRAFFVNVQYAMSTRARTGQSIVLYILHPYEMSSVTSYHFRDHEMRVAHVNIRM